MSRDARPHRFHGLAIAAVLLLLPAAAFAQSCDLQTLATVLHAGTMPDMQGCPRAVVEQALHVSEIRSAIATGPSDAAAGVVYGQVPGPGAAIRPGMLATIRVSDGSNNAGGIATDSPAGDGVASTSAADGAVAGALAADPVASDAGPVMPASTDAAPTDSTPPDSAPTDSAQTDSALVEPESADATPPADVTSDGASAGDATVDSVLGADTGPGAATNGDATEGIATNGIATNGIATNGIAAAAAAEPGNVPGLVATPAGALAIPRVTEAQVSASVPERVAAMPGWWWIALALALTLIVAGVVALLRQRRIRWQQPAWEQRVHARGVIVPQGRAMPVGEIPLAAMPFSVAASLGVGEVALIGDIPTRTQDA